MATKKVSSDGQTEKQVLPKAPQYEGVDPLTDGNRYYSEDVKGSSVHDQDTAQVQKSAKKNDKTLKEQKVAEKVADNKAEKAAKKASK